MAKKNKTIPLDGMPVPNHMVPLTLTRVPGTSKVDTQRYPLLHLHKSQEGLGASEGVQFVDEIYGLEKWVDRAIDAPPTWMDPEIFVRMLLQDEEVIRLCRNHVKRNSATRRMQLVKAIQRCFEEYYIAYLLEQFEGAKDNLALWMIAHFKDRSRTL